MANSLRNEIPALIEDIADKLIAKHQTISTVESCTGGMIAQELTAVSGSSTWFEYGFVTYSNEAKTALVGVDANMVNDFGAVSETVVKAMALGGLAKSAADYTISVSGIAGPTGAVSGKPVGTVCIGIASKNNSQPPGSAEPASVEAHTFYFNGDRDSVRVQACHKSLQLLLAVL